LKILPSQLFSQEQNNSMTLKQKTNKMDQPPKEQRKRPLLWRILHSFCKDQDAEEPRFDTIGGVYATEVCDDANTKQEESFSSIESCETQSSRDSLSSWNSSGSPDHHKGSPLLVRRAISQRSINPDGIELGDAELLGRIMLRSRKLPKNNGYYSSNHVMINNERTKRMIPPLKRIPDMDELAREQAKLMAADNRLYHRDPADLTEKLGQQCGCRIGENATRGSNVQAIHNAMMDSRADRNNIIDRRFTCMGIGTAKAADGTLYLCQLFRNE
jgi:hypothetical protein